MSIGHIRRRRIFVKKIINQMLDKVDYQGLHFVYTFLLNYISTDNEG